MSIRTMIAAKEKSHPLIQKVPADRRGTRAPGGPAEGGVGEGAPGERSGERRRERGGGGVDRAPLLLSSPCYPPPSKAGLPPCASLPPRGAAPRPLTAAPPLRQVVDSKSSQVLSMDYIF